MKNIAAKYNLAANAVFTAVWRRKRDSNPRGLSPKRFSRPPRYDRFDIPPNIKLLENQKQILKSKIIIPKNFVLCQVFAQGRQ